MIRESRNHGRRSHLTHSTGVNIRETYSEWVEKNCHTHKEIIRVGDIAADAEQLHQIMKLAVNITAYLIIANKLRQLPSLSYKKVSIERLTVTGAVTVTTLPSSIRSSLAR